MDIQHPQFY